MGLQGIYRGIERFTWVYKDIQGFTEVIQRISITGLYKGLNDQSALQGYTRVYSIPWECWDF